MDLLYPGSVNIERVNVQAQQELDILHNYSLLQVAFRKKGITKVSGYSYGSILYSLFCFIFLSSLLICVSLLVSKLAIRPRC